MVVISHLLHPVYKSGLAARCLLCHTEIHRDTQLPNLLIDTNVYNHHTVLELHLNYLFKTTSYFIYLYRHFTFTFRSHFVPQTVSDSQSVKRT